MARPIFLALGAVLALSGCEVSPDGGLVGPPGFLSDFSSPGSRGGISALAQPDPERSLIRAAQIAGGDVVATGPEGYCIDPSTVETSRSGGFAVLASCNILSAGEAGDWVVPALITVTVGPAEREVALPDPATIAKLAQAPLIEGRSANGLALAYLGSGGDSLFATGSPRYWRGAFLQGRRLVSLAIYAPADSGLTQTQGARLLERTRAGIVASSPEAEVPVSARGDGGSNG